MSTIIITNNTANDIELTDLRGFEVPASGTDTLSDYFSAYEIANSEVLLNYVADNTITVNNGTADLSSPNGLKWCLGEFNQVKILDEFRDRSGKLRVHQTSRKLGMRIMWTGIGDDPTDPSAVGGGEYFRFGHDPTVSGMDSDPATKYIDFNCVENETWLHEGYITWKDAEFDTLTLEMVPRTTSVVPSASGNYDLYGGYLIVPAMPGQGSINITSDITTHSGGLIYMPNNDLNEPPTAFWDAEWDSDTQRYTNITPAPYGNGRYNMFIVEVVFARFMNNINLLGSGFIAMNSSDTDQFGHGMRLKMIADTNNHAGDHAWYLGCTMCLHRDRSL